MGFSRRIRGAFLDRRSVHLVFLASILSFGVVAWEHGIHTYLYRLSGSPIGHFQHWLRDSFLTMPIALAAVWVGLWVARRIGLSEELSWHLPARAAVVSAVFLVFLMPSVGLHQRLDSLLDGLEGAAGPGAAALHGLRDALIGQVVALPLLALGLAVLTVFQARRTAPPHRGRSLRPAPDPALGAHPTAGAQGRPGGQRPADPSRRTGGCALLAQGFGRRLSWEPAGHTLRSTSTPPAGPGSQKPSAIG